MIVLVILAYAFLAYIQMVPLWKNKQWRPFWANAFISALSFVVAVLLSLNVNIPSPSEPIKKLIEGILGK